MDTITQALLGAACGNVCARHKLGRRAARWGAVGGALPDLDVIAGFVGGPFIEMQHHRGVTHSLWFGPVVGSALGLGLWRYYAGVRARSPSHEDAALGQDDRRLWWMALLAVSILSHPLLDLFTTYGTQLLAPFSDRRFAVDAIGIIDPIYSVPLAVALGLGGADVKKTQRASLAALAFTTGYLFFGLWLNHRAEGLAVASLERRGVTGATVNAYPRVLQIFGRRLVGRADDRVFVGQVSMFAPRPIDWHEFRPATGALVDAVRATPEGALFEWFAMGQTVARVQEGGANGDEGKEGEAGNEGEGGELVVEIDDMRYGDVATPELSMWGIRARFRGGALAGPVERFRRPLDGGARASLARMWRDTFTPP